MIYEVMMSSGSNTFTAVDAESGVLTQKNYTVQSSSGYGITNIVTKTTNYTVTSTDDVILVNASASPVTITVPDASTVPGKRITIKRIEGSSNAVTIVSASGQMIDDYMFATITASMDTVTVVSNGTDAWYVLGVIGTITKASTTLLLHMDGSNGSTTITDSSTLGNVVTVLGNAQLSTAQSKFGTSSLLLDGAGDYITIPDSSSFDFGSGDFTIECWIRPTAYSANNGGSYSSVVVAKSTSGAGSGSFYYGIGGTASSYTSMFIGYSTDGSAHTDISAAATINLNTWYHIAVTRSGSKLYFFLDGTLLNAGGTNFTYTLYNNTIPLKIGALDYDATYKRYFPGYIDELRITKGFARYTASFTAPTSPFSN